MSRPSFLQRSTSATAGEPKEIPADSEDEGWKCSRYQFSGAPAKLMQNQRAASTWPAAV